MKNLAIICIAAVLVLSLASANAHAAVKIADFNISLVGQDPSLAIPGKYVDLTFSAKGGVAYAPNDVNFEAVEKFPFTLEPGSEKTVNLGDVQVIGKATEKNELLFKIRLLVDSRAAEGDNEFEYKYSVGGSTYSEKINIKVSNVQSDFDVIVQEVSDGSVSLGIVNTGENAAKSVVIKIPAQEYFETRNIDSSILGNLDSGDFTVASFTINPKTEQKQNLNVLVSYTDIEGTRHTLAKSVQLQLSKQETSVAQKGASLSALSNPALTIILILIIVVLAYFAFFKKK